MNIDTVNANLPIEIIIAFFKAGEEGDTTFETRKFGLCDGRETLIFEGRNAGVFSKSLSERIGFKGADAAS